MDEKVARLIQREGAAALLDRGVSVPLKDIRLPFRKPLRLRVVMRRPRLGGLIRLARVYLSLGVTAEQMNKFTKEEEMAFLVTHGKQVSRMVAYTLCRGWISRRLLVGATAGSQLDRHRVCLGRHAQLRVPVGHRPFYEYYQISREDEPDEAETEPKKQGELKTVFEPSHSPFGFIWQVADATGWKVKYILEGVNFQTLIMMLADAPRYIRKKQEEKSAEDEAADIVGFFQSNLKR
jgi:hypothetical protein